MKLLQTKTSCFSKSPFAKNENSLKNEKITDERFCQEIQSYFFQSLKNNYEQNSKTSCKNKGRNSGRVFLDCKSFKNLKFVSTCPKFLKAFNF